ncbi:LysM peptidoglycan-binding domain-containing protein [Paenibacillus sp. 1P07SE]|uniref:LysM peptidoglycan-binding domain-containing protein n=1 Tax=Paenibacillus sp. 1P07SE TaxID=3132209 RepID=UPI0039A58231
MMMQTTTYRSIHTSDNGKEHKQIRQAPLRQSSVFFLPKAAAVILIIGLLMSGVLLADSYAFPVELQPLEHEEIVIVTTGDTLWKIATTHKPAGMDVREAVYLLQSRNALQGSSLVAGQSLILPF